MLRWPLCCAWKMSCTRAALSGELSAALLSSFGWRAAAPKDGSALKQGNSCMEWGLLQGLVRWRTEHVFFSFQ